MTSSANSVVHGYAPSDQDIGELDSATHMATRRPSWYKRLSLSNSHVSSPAPLSPSVSCSNNDSMAFSHKSSTVPVISPLPPNKLVKRSSSVQHRHETQVRGPASRRPSFRRPATSHQRRSATLLPGVHLQTTMERPSTDEPEYTNFFTAKKSKSFRRILPNGKHPTLVLAKSITAGTDNVDESVSDDCESLFFLSRPATPLITAVIETEVAEDASRPRRSFSINNLLSSASDAKRQRTAKARLYRRSSAPLPTMSRRRNSLSQADVRREFTDSALGRRAITTAAGAAPSQPPHAEQIAGPLLSPQSAHAARVALSRGSLAAVPQPEKVIELAAPAANQAPPSPTLAQPGARPSRSTASTLVDSSDHEVRGVGSGDDEDGADIQSDTLFDSVRTGATKSTSSARGPRIETIFDESPPSKVKITALRDLLPPGAFGEYTTHGAAGQYSITEEEESISTPVRTIRPERSLQDSPSFARTHNVPLFPNLIPSSPPSMPKPLSLGTLEWDARVGDDDSSRWSLEDDAKDPWVDLPIASQVATPVSLHRSNSHLLATGSSPKPTTPQHLTADPGDRDTRSSIFDWSEQQPADKSAGNRTPPRPRTVHGKKDADRRGSRSVGRRVPSGLHARSQSVPVVPDAAGKRSTVVTNKFGTWGVGSKGVTEDWNDDFDFSELPEDPVAEAAGDASRVDSGSAIIVPRSIQEQQNNVLANIGLLREWGLLIEELKEQKTRAMALGIVEGQHSGMWEEVDAMIDLADQEADHEGVHRLSPPSSPGFDEDAFEDLPAPSPSNDRRRRKSGSPGDDYSREHTPSQPPRRKSILPSNYGIFAPQSSPIPPKPKYEVPSRPPVSTPIVTRPRKDSEAKARSVIEALQQRKSTIDPIANTPPTPSKKVPFDTATLRRIVPYVNTLTRRVKDAIRGAEGLYSSPNTSPLHEDPSFSKIFHHDGDLAARIQRMSVQTTTI
jgi:hypothetical protein